MGLIKSVKQDRQAGPARPGPAKQLSIHCDAYEEQYYGVRKSSSPPCMNFNLSSHTHTHCQCQHNNTNNVNKNRYLLNIKFNQQCVIETNKQTNERGKNNFSLSLPLSHPHTLFSLFLTTYLSLTLKLSHSCFETNFYRHPPFVISPALKRPLLCHNHFSFSDPKTQTHTHPLATQHKTGKMSLWNSVITGLNWYFCFICFNKAQFSFRTL